MKGEPRKRKSKSKVGIDCASARSSSGRVSCLGFSLPNVLSLLLLHSMSNVVGLPVAQRWRLDKEVGGRMHADSPKVPEGQATPVSRPSHAHPWPKSKVHAPAQHSNPKSGGLFCLCASIEEMYQRRFFFLSVAARRVVAWGGAHSTLELAITTRSNHTPHMQAPYQSVHVRRLTLGSPHPLEG